MGATEINGPGWACAALALVMSLSLCRCAAGEERPPKYKVRTWRIVVNDDGEVPIPGKKRTLEQFLAPKFNDVLNTQVDAYFLCLGSTDRHVPPQRARLQDTMNQWAHDGKIPDHLDAKFALTSPRAAKRTWTCSCPCA